MTAAIPAPAQPQEAIPSHVPSQSTVPHPLANPAPVFSQATPHQPIPSPLPSVSTAPLAASSEDRKRDVTQMHDGNAVSGEVKHVKKYLCARRVKKEPN